MLRCSEHAADDEQYRKARPMFQLEPLSSSVNVLDKLLGVVSGSQGRINFGWQFETYLDAAGMRAAALDTEQEWEDMI